MGATKSLHAFAPIVRHASPRNSFVSAIATEVTGKWVKARYVAERHEIAARYAKWAIIGTPEIRDVDPGAALFHGLEGRAARGATADGRIAARASTQLCPTVRNRCIRSVSDDAVSSEVRHILRAAKTIRTNARRRTVTSQSDDYCRLERLTSASSEAAVSTNS
jgi:hypothetical protein